MRSGSLLFLMPAFMSPPWRAGRVLVQWTHAEKYEASKRRFVVMVFHLKGMSVKCWRRTVIAPNPSWIRPSQTERRRELVEAFIRYEKTAPGKSACGNIHFAPNSQVDYDWSNPTDRQ